MGIGLISILDKDVVPTKKLIQRIGRDIPKLDACEQSKTLHMNLKQTLKDYLILRASEGIRTPE